jgi:hypothetical protein
MQNTPYFDNTTGQLDIYGEDGTATTQIDRVTYARFGNTDATPIAEMYWSPDNRTLAYFRQDALNKNLMLYDVQSHTTRIVLTVPSEYYYNVSFSEDGSLLAVGTIYNPSTNGPNAWLIHLNDGRISPLILNAEQAPIFAWRRNLLAYSGWDKGPQMMSVNVVDGTGTFLLRYPVPVSKVDALYWSNCQD